MTNSTYLSPGFLVTLGEQRGVIKFPQFDGKLRRATPARLALVDALNRGYTGSPEALLADLASGFDVKQPVMREFFLALEQGGHLTHTPPQARFSLPGPVAQSPAESLAVGEEVVTIAAPASLMSQEGKYFWHDHHGKLLVTLTLTELLACSCFTQPMTADAAWTRHQKQKHFEPLGREAFDDLATRLKGAGLLIPPGTAENLDDTPLFGTVDIPRLHELVDARVAEHDLRAAESGRELVQVVPVNTRHGIAPQSLGMLIAYAMEYEGGRLCEKYDFIPMFYTDESRMVERAARPGIFLFSNYIWNVDENLRISAAVKSVNPANITIHGGPSTPKYEKDSEEFFARNPHVDITIRGEGELTMADVLDKLDLANSGDLGVLDAAPGLSYRGADGSVVRTGDRERIADLDTIPSPLLKGLFNEYGSMKAAVIIETNRGCPYGCTFCDWGSATLSKVRRFDLRRVFDELEWSAQHEIEDAAIADANFGMLERDVQIAEKIADLKRQYGYPRTVNINYAKNQVRYLKKIIEIFSAVDILAEGVVSLQSMDETTLKVIDRANIKLDKYNELATEFRRSKLPLAADIMMGLPGSTPEAFRSDLQQCTDRDIRVRANYTQLLPNSPMNDPEYRVEHGIKAMPGEILKETSTYSRSEWDEMDKLRLAYYLLDSYGVLRYVARYLRRETGMGEVHFYDRFQTDVYSNPGRWPILATCLNMLNGYMAPPGSWGLFIEDVRRYLVSELGVADDAGLRTALAVQHAHLPDPSRRFPEVLELEHDYAAWQDVVLTTREEGHRDDWHEHTPRLVEFGPATLTIDDPNLICRRDVGKPKYVLDYNLRTWELDSPVARPRLKTTTSLAS